MKRFYRHIDSPMTIWLWDADVVALFMILCICWFVVGGWKLFVGMLIAPPFYARLKKKIRRGAGYAMLYILGQEFPGYPGYHENAFYN